MHTILVPTDFSPVAENAARYAVNLAKQTGIKKIILYYAYQQPLAIDPENPSVGLVNLSTLNGLFTQGVNKFKKVVEGFDTGDMAIEALSEYAILEDGINSVCLRQKVDLIVMGVTGGNKLDETLIGSSALNVARRAEKPVIIVPPAATPVTPVKTVVFATDLKKVAETTPVQPIKEILDETNAALLVLNIGGDAKYFSAEARDERIALDNLFDGYSPEYHFVDDTDFIGAVNGFAEDNKADLIIIIPKKHGFFEKLIKESHTKQLAFHGHVPVMVVHS